MLVGRWIFLYCWLLFISLCIMDDSLDGSLAREGPVSFIALLDAFPGQIADVLYGDKL